MNSNKCSLNPQARLAQHNPPSWDSTGFTLIELIVVIVLIGILAGFAVPKYVDLTKEAKRQVNQDIFRKFAEQMDKARMMKTIRKTERDLDFNGDGNTDLRFKYGYPSGAKMSGTNAFHEIGDYGNGTDNSGLPCIDIFRAVMSDGVTLGTARLDDLTVNNCLEKSDICIQAAAFPSSSSFACVFAFTNTYQQSDPNLGNQASIEAFIYYVISEVVVYGYSYGTLLVLDGIYGSAFSDPVSPGPNFMKPLIVLGDIEAAKALEDVGSPPPAP